MLDIFLGQFEKITNMEASLVKLKSKIYNRLKFLRVYVKPYKLTSSAICKAPWVSNPKAHNVATLLVSRQ